MKNNLIVLVSFIFVFLLAYYIKCQLRINVFESTGISKHFPFKYLQASPNSIFVDPQVGTLLKDTFESPFWSERN